MPVDIDRNRLQEVSHLELFAKEVVEGFIVGMHKSPFHGFSVEFAEHRQYNQGDSTRHIDWKLFARTDKLYQKKYEEETNLRAQLVIDTSSSMYYPEDFDFGESHFNKIKFSVYAAAALIELLRRQRDAVGISFFDTDLRKHTRAKTSMAHHQYLYDELSGLISEASVKKGRNSSTVQALHEIAEDTHRRSLVLIFSDMMDDGGSEKQEDLFNALQHLRHNKHEVVLFHVMDKSTELDFDFESRPHTFIDPETGEEVKVNPGDVKQAYRKAAQKFFDDLKAKCSQYQIDYIPADIGEGFNAIMTEYLTKRKRMT